MTSGVPEAVGDAARLEAVERTGLFGTAGEEGFDRLAAAAASFCGAPLAFVTLVDDELSWYKSAVGLPPDAPRCGPVEASFCKYVIESRRPLVVADARRDPRTVGNPAIDTMGVAAWAGYPVVDEDGEVLGSFCVVDTEPREWTGEQVELLDVLAGAAADEIRLRVSVAAERKARSDAEDAWLRVTALSREQARMVSLFQRSLLPARLPRVPGLETAVCYESANDVGDIGGDWYDLIERADGKVVLVVGDVAGHDLEAVAAMAQLRHAVHVAALRLAGPWELVNHANTLLYELGIDRFASLVCMFWDPDAGELSHVSAGHAPSLLVDVSGTASYLPDGRARLLGVDPGEVVATVGRRRFEPGERLVMFTDGLFETRSASIDAGLAQVGAIVEAHGDLDPTGLCDAVLSELRPAGGWRDDVALMIVDRTTT